VVARRKTSGKESKWKKFKKEREIQLTLHIGELRVNACLTMASLASPLLASSAPFTARPSGKQVRRATRAAVRTMAGPLVGA
jgi:hypothetical protein